MTTKLSYNNWISNFLLFGVFYFFFSGIAAEFFPGTFFSLAGFSDTPAVEGTVALSFLGAQFFALSVACLIIRFSPTTHWGLIIFLFFSNLFDLAIVAKYFDRLAGPAAIGFVVLDVMFCLFCLILLVKIFRARSLSDKENKEELSSALNIKPLDISQTLAELSDEKPLALVFIRHSGCTFCRDTLAKLAEERKSLEAKGVTLGVVGMSEPQVLKELAASFGLSDILLVSDPDRRLYKALEIPRGGLFQVLGLKDVWYAYKTGALKRHGMGPIDADGLQLGGSFVIYKRAVIASHKAKSSSEVCPIGALVPEIH